MGKLELSGLSDPMKSNQERDLRQKISLTSVTLAYGQESPHLNDGIEAENTVGCGKCPGECGKDQSS